jgi:hypothetical protein
MNAPFLAAFGEFMDMMQGNNHQLPRESDLDHAISLVRVLSCYYDDEVSGDLFTLCCCFFATIRHAPWP